MSDPLSSLHCRSVATSRVVPPAMHSHLCADDTQIYAFSSLSTASVLQSRVSACVVEVSLWIRSNRLQLNPAKTEIIWFSLSRRQFQIPQVPFHVGTATIALSSIVRNLGIYLDSKLSTA